jgi:hypothetical protein
MKKNYFRLTLIIAAIILSTVTTTTKLSAQVTIGSETAPPDYSLLEIDATNTKGGLHLPKMTTVERDAFASATSLGASAEGLLIWNKTRGKFEVWNGSAWIQYDGVIGGNPTRISQQPRSFNWKEQATATRGEPMEGIGGQKPMLSVTATDATAYQWYEIPINPNAAHIHLGSSNGANTPDYQPDLSQLGMRRYYCKITGNTAVESEIVRVAVGCGALDYIGSWRSMMCYNLGADPDMTIEQQMAYQTTANTDSTVYGHLFQWGRIADGHQRRDSPSVRYHDTIHIYTNGTIVDQVDPLDEFYHGKFIYTPATNGIILNGGKWNPKPDDTGWSPQGYYNNPCPSGWRLPTSDEIAAIYMGTAASLSKMSDATPNTMEWIKTTTQGTVFKPDGVTTTLFLPMASLRLADSGNFMDSGVRSIIRVSSPQYAFQQFSSDEWHISSFPYPWNLPRVRLQSATFGAPVRCIAL